MIAPGLLAEVHRLADDPEHPEVATLARAVLAVLAPSPSADERGGIAKVEQWTGLDRSTVFRKCKTGTFPAPQYVGPIRVWRRSVVEAWIHDQSHPRPEAKTRSVAALAARARKAKERATPHPAAPGNTKRGKHNDDHENPAERRQARAGRRVEAGQAAADVQGRLEGRARGKQDPRDHPSQAARQTRRQVTSGHEREGRHVH